MAVETVRNGHPLAFEVDLVYVAAEEGHVTKHLSNGIDDVGQVQIARRDLVQHRSEEKEVLAVHNGHVEPRIAAFFKLQCGIKAAKSTAENEDASFFVAHTSLRVRCARLEAARPTTMPGTGNRVACAAARHRKSQRYGLVPPR